jgi:hypothetical protein
MNESNKVILSKLLSQGDKLAIVKGCLVITTASRKQVPAWWLLDNGSMLIMEIMNLLNINAYSYTGYSTGRYGKKLYQGVTLQFECIESGNEAFAILNADITRQRSCKHGKAGDDLPNGQFRVSNKHNFYKFWKLTGIKFPARKSAFYDYMGKLKSVLFIGELGCNNKFNNKTLRPLDLSSELIMAAYIQSLPDNIQTTSKQYPNNYQTRMPNKEIALKPAANDIALDSSTCESKYGLSYQGSVVISNILPVNKEHKAPHKQSNDEWMNEWEHA